MSRSGLSDSVDELVLSLHPEPGEVQLGFALLEERGVLTMPEPWRRMGATRQLAGLPYQLTPAYERLKVIASRPSVGRHLPSGEPEVRHHAARVATLTPYVLRPYATGPHLFGGGALRALVRVADPQAQRDVLRRALSPESEDQLVALAIIDELQPDYGPELIFGALERAERPDIVHGAAELLSRHPSWFAGARPHILRGLAMRSGPGTPAGPGFGSNPVFFELAVLALDAGAVTESMQALSGRIVTARGASFLVALDQPWATRALMRAMPESPAARTAALLSSDEVLATAARGLEAAAARRGERRSHRTVGGSELEEIRRRAAEVRSRVDPETGRAR